MKSFRKGFFASSQFFYFCNIGRTALEGCLWKTTKAGIIPRPQLVPRLVCVNTFCVLPNTGIKKWTVAESVRVAALKSKMMRL